MHIHTDKGVCGYVCVCVCECAYGLRSFCNHAVPFRICVFVYVCACICMCLHMCLHKCMLLHLKLIRVCERVSRVRVRVSASVYFALERMFHLCKRMYMAWKHFRLYIRACAFFACWLCLFALALCMCALVLFMRGCVVCASVLCTYAVVSCVRARV